MQEAVTLLDQLAKSKSFQEVPQVLKLAMSNLFKIAKTTTSKLAEHSQLLQSLLLRAQDTQVKLSDKTNYKDIEQLVRIVGKYEPFEDKDYSSNIDIRLTSRNSARDLSTAHGLDRVMIEEVKTIAEALIEKRLQGRNYEDWTGDRQDRQERQERQSEYLRVESTASAEMRQVRADIAKLTERINQINQRKVDQYELEQRVRQERIYLNEEIEKSARKSKLKVDRTDDKEKILKVEHDIENIRHSIKKQNFGKPIADFGITSQLQQIRVALDKKPDRKQFTDLKSRVLKQVTSKISLQDTEKIIKSFQQQIFDKLTHQRKQTQLQTHKLIRMEIMRNQQDLPTNRIAEIKNSLTRVQKKISNKLMSERQESTTDAIARVQSELKHQIKKVQEESCKQAKALFEIIQAGLEEDNKVSRFSLRKTKTTEVVLDWAKWSCTGDSELKNNLVCWDRQDYNISTDNFLWEKRKTQILVVSPGTYQLKLAVFCNRRPIVTVLVNNEPVSTAQKSIENTTVNSTFSTMIVDFLTLPARARISVRIEGECQIQAVLCLTKY